MSLRDILFRQSVASVPQASSPVTPEQQAQANVMPQQQSNIARTTATVHPYTVDTRAMSTRQAAAAAAIYGQQTIPQNMYYQPQYSNPKQAQVLSSTFPVHPDVRFKRLPFYDIMADLIKPSTLVPQTNQRMQEQPFYFHLTPQQATDIASSRDIRPGVKCDYIKQVQLRFCLLETTCEQEDCFPPQVMVKVNNKLCPLPNPIPTNKPGVEPKRPPRPVNITQMVKLSPTVANQITVSWAADYGRGYALTVALVHKLTSTDLLQRLQKKGAKHADHTRALIKEKLSDDGDCEIATTSLRVSLMCPLGKMRMTTPCRPQTCAHLQCFDASLFLQMNERKPTWNCPVCDKPALYDSLVIDGYFQEVLSSSLLPSECNEIQLLKDGSWSSHHNEKKVPKVEKLTTTSIAIDDSIEIIEDNVEVVSTNTLATSSTDMPKESEKKKEVVDLTLSDSDDDEPLAKRRPPPKPDSTIKLIDFTNPPQGSREGKMVPKVKKVAKTEADSREYRTRKKAFENAVIAGSVTSVKNDAFQPASQHNLRDNSIDVRPRSLLGEALSRQSSQGTQETGANHRQFVVQVDVHQQDLSTEAPSPHMPPSTHNKTTVRRKSKKAKTAAERVRAYRERKKALKNMSNQQSMVDAAHSHVDDITVLEDQPQEIIKVGTATIRAPKRPYTGEPQSTTGSLNSSEITVVNHESTPNIVTSLTVSNDIQSDQVDIHQQDLSTEAPSPHMPPSTHNKTTVKRKSKKAKTAAERVRAYRERKKALKNMSNQQSMVDAAHSHVDDITVLEDQPQEIIKVGTVTVRAPKRPYTSEPQSTSGSLNSSEITVTNHESTPNIVTSLTVSNDIQSDQVDIHQQDLSTEAPSPHMPPSTHNKTTVKRKSKKAKTAAERVRAYRERKKALKNMSNQQSMVDAAHSHVDDITVLEDQPQEIIKVGTVTVRAPKRPYTSEPQSTSGSLNSSEITVTNHESTPNIVTSLIVTNDIQSDQVDIHQQDLSTEAPSPHMPPSTHNKTTVRRKSKKAKTAAERVRAYRERKKALKNMSNQQSMVDAAHSHVDDITVLEDQPQEIIKVGTVTVRAPKRPYTSEPQSTSGSLNSSEITVTNHESTPNIVTSLTVSNDIQSDQVDIHQQDLSTEAPSPHMPPSTHNKTTVKRKSKNAKTAAERALAYRERKKALKNISNLQSMVHAAHSHVDDITVLEDQPQEIIKVGTATVRASKRPYTSEPQSTTSGSLNSSKITNKS